jgi:hypothetical protein
MSENTMRESPVKENAIMDCKYCQEKIRDAAKVCYHCGRDQRWFINYFSNITVVVSIGLLVLSFMQLYQTTVARKNTEKALEAANNAVKRTQQAEEKVLKTQTELREVVKLSVENSFITAQGGIGLRMGVAPEAKKRLESNLGQLSKFAKPDSREEERWWAEIRKLFPELNKERK